MPRLPLLLAALAMAAAAGCLGDDASPAALAPGAGAAPGPGNATAAEPVSLYSLDETVAGASAPHPDGGALAEQVPLAKVDRFTVPEGVGNLTFEGEIPTGAGTGRIDVLDPAGVLVWSSAQNVLVGAPGVVGLGLTIENDVPAPEAWPAGEYEVRVYVAGAMQAQLEILGVPAGPPAA